MHGATGAEWEIWRGGYPLGEQTGRVGALDRLRSGLGGRQGCVRRGCPRARPRSAAARRALTRGGRLIKASFAPSRPAHTRRRSGEQKPGLYCVTTAQGARLWAPRAPDLEQRLGADAAGRYCRDSGRALPYPTERAGPGPIWPFTGPLRAVVIALRSASRQGAGRIAPERPLTAAAVP